MQQNYGQDEFHERFRHAGDLLLRTQQKFEAINRNRIEAGMLLCLVAESKAWTTKFSSFESYVEEELKISLRTAQQLMKTVRKCVESQIELVEVAELGWSKLALVLNHLTHQNKENVLQDVTSMPLAELKSKYKKVKETADKNERQTKTDTGTAIPTIILTATLQQALLKAAVQTKSDDLTTNLDFLASRFLSESGVVSVSNHSAKSPFTSANNDPDTAHLN